MWCRVDLMWTDISEERIASIFRVEKFAREETAWAGGCNLYLLEDITLLYRARTTSGESIPGVHMPGDEIDNWHSSVTEVKSEWSYTSFLLISLLVET
jgi:hypothetical protein